MWMFCVKGDRLGKMGNCLVKVSSFAIGDADEGMQLALAHHGFQAQRGIYQPCSRSAGGLTEEELVTSFEDELEVVGNSDVCDERRHDEETLGSLAQ